MVRLVVSDGIKSPSAVRSRTLMSTEGFDTIAILRRSKEPDPMASYHPPKTIMGNQFDHRSRNSLVLENIACVASRSR